MNDKQLELIATGIALAANVYDKDRVKDFIISEYKKLEDGDDYDG